VSESGQNSLPPVSLHRSICLPHLIHPARRTNHPLGPNRQKILSTDYLSFSVFGLGFVFVTGGLIAVVSYMLDPILGCLRRRYNVRTYQQLEWCTNSTMQLQRLAYEEAGSGTWSKATSNFPVTLKDEELALLDLTDPKHPRLERGVNVKGNTSNGSKGTGGMGEEMRERERDGLQTQITSRRNSKATAQVHAVEVEQSPVMPMSVREDDMSIRVLSPAVTMVDGDEAWEPRSDATALDDHAAGRSSGSSSSSSTESRGGLEEPVRGRRGGEAAPDGHAGPRPRTQPGAGF
jgi:hypothetical protein